MPRNIEIKAIVPDLSKLFLRVAQVTKSEGETILQTDTFYNVSQGRLKLREIKGEGSQLISYNRDDKYGPKLSSYSIAPVSDSEALNKTLTHSLGVKGRLEKVRYFFPCGQTRIHVDQVENLGYFVELEVVLRPDQTTEQGEQIVNELMVKLDIKPEDLRTGAYIDLIGARL